MDFPLILSYPCISRVSSTKIRRNILYTSCCKLQLFDITESFLMASKFKSLLKSKHHAWDRTTILFVDQFYYIYKVPNGRIRTKICVIPSLNNLIPIHEKYQMLGLIPMWQTNAGGHLRIHYRISWGPLTALLLFFFLLVMMIVFHHEEYKIGNYGWSALMESYLSRDCVDKFGQGPKSHNYNYLSVAWKKRIMNMVTMWWQ